MKKDGHEHQNQSAKPSFWSLVVGILFIVGTACLILLSWWIYVRLNPDYNWIVNFDEFSKIALGIIALIGLGLAAWRSHVGTIQNELQFDQGKRFERQLANATEQIRLADEQLKETKQNNLVKTFFDAAKLLTSVSKTEQFAGLGLLRTIGMQKDIWLQADAIQLLRDFIYTVEPKGSDNPLLIRALDNLNAIGEACQEQISLNNIILTGKDDYVRIEDYRYNLCLNYHKYRFYFFDFKTFYPAKGMSYYGIFRDCKFTRCDITDDLIFSDLAQFHQCRIYGIMHAPQKDVMDKTRFIFNNCDFTHFLGVFDYDTADFNNCFYVGDVDLPEDLKRHLKQYKPKEKHLIIGCYETKNKI